MNSHDNMENRGHLGSVNNDNLETEEQFLGDSENEVLVEGSSSKISDSDEPKDHYMIVYILFYFFGVTSLMPWTFFITATDYWMYKFRDVSPHNYTITLGRTTFQAEFISYVNVASSVSGTAFLILNSLYGDRWSLKLRMNGSLCIIILSFILTTSFVVVNTDDWQTEFFIITMAIVFIMNGAGALFTGGLFGIAGKFPSRYMAAVVSGQALGGIIAAIAQILSLAFQVSPSHSALIYFLIADVMVVTSLVSFIYTRRLHFFKFYTSRERHTLTINRSREVSLKIILGKIWIYCLSTFLVFATTVAVYPSVTVLVVSHHNGPGTVWNNVYFIPVVNYLLFSCGDYCGRLTAGFLLQPSRKAWIIAAASALRIIGLPLIMYCNAQPRHSLPVFINSDYGFIAIVIIFALSNGYLTNMCFINASRTVEDNEQEKASSVMAAVLGVGISIGAALSVMCVRLL